MQAATIQFSKRDNTKCSVKEYRIYGCKTPSEKEPQPQLFVSTIFASNAVIAESKFFKLITNQYKIKPSNGTVVKIEEVPQDNDFVVKNYGIRFTYRTRTGLCNGYKEVRHISKALAAHSFFTEFGSKHKLKQHEFYIIEFKQLADNEVTKSRILPYVGKDVKFPIFFKTPNTISEIVPISTDIFN
ncbi:60S ribosomal protein L20B [Glugoides intestinalis]